MSAPATYDPSSPNEQAPPLPSAPLVHIGPLSVLQPPLSRRGRGPGLIIILPAEDVIRDDDERNSESTNQKPRSLDPEPMQKWAEEGFAVVAATVPKDHRGYVFLDIIKDASEALKTHSSVDVKDKIGLIIYDESLHEATVTSQLPLETYSIACMVTFSYKTSNMTFRIPCISHTSTLVTTTKDSEAERKLESSNVVVTYPDTQKHFVLPSSSNYDPASANLAHTRSLVFLKKHLGGPNFDLEAIWEEHTYWEFEKRSVAQTMATMVAEPYVNHVPTMTGGMGREKLEAFYRDHFIFCNPPDTTLKPVSRTVGVDRVIDEFIFSCTHSSHIPWLLPRVPPTHKLLTIPMMAVVNIRGDRLYHEHIWWDQATVLRQAGILPTHLPLDAEAEAGGELVKLPVAGSECARLLVDERDGKSNEMIG